MNVDELRNQLCEQGLSRSDLNQNPVKQFEQWFNLALSTSIREPNAMVLSTVEDGSPWQRTVLLKHFDDQGFVFYTNYDSKKAQQIRQNNEVSILFPWYALQRQVIIKGAIEKTDNEMSLQYFQSRSRGSQIGAWASKQSETLSNRDELAKRVDDIEDKFKEVDALPLPPFWGGYRIKPYRYEFWQGRQDRLHDRFIYSQKALNHTAKTNAKDYSNDDLNNKWHIEQLYP